MIRCRLLFLAAVACLVLLTACGGNKGVNNELPSAGRVAGDKDAALGLAAGPPVSSAAQLAQADDSRQIVYTATLRVQVGDVTAAGERAVKIAEDAEGLLFAQSADLQGTQSADLTLKVPPARFSAVLRDLGALGTVLERTQTADDVTEQVVDLEGRLRSAQSSTDRLRGLLGQAGSAADVVAIEGELAKREAELESLTGRLRSLQAQADLATVTLSLVEKGEPEPSDDIPGFTDGLKAGSAALVNVLNVIMLLVGALLPFLPFVALALFALLRYRRWRRARARPVKG